MAKDILHVVPNENGWSVKREGNERSSSTHATQKEAIDSARSLAREGDDIIIHRPDGTIRDRTTYTGTMEGNGNGSAPARPELHDVASVGSRVSWPAVLAGVAVAATAYVALTLLALAIGVSTVDTVQSRSFAIGAAIIGIFNLLVALFLGGYVATRLSTRETQGEAVVHGVLVWAALFFVVLLTGINMGGSFGMLTQITRTPAAEVAVPPPAEQQRADAIRARGEQLVSEMNPVAVAWWAFAGMAVSVLAAVGGAVVGSGPELRLRLWRTPAQPRVEPEGRMPTPQPA